jgi:hypothetical protein
MQAVVLLQQGSPINSAGYGLGFAASTFLFSYYINRAKETGAGAGRACVLEGNSSLLRGACYELMVAWWPCSALFQPHE